MIGIFLIYFIGNSFYKLAEQFQRNKWVFAILGVVSYYAGGFLFGVIAAIAYPIMTGNFIEDTSSIVWDIVAIPFGIGSCYGLYKLLKYQWSKPEVRPSNDILDADMMK